MRVDGKAAILVLALAASVALGGCSGRSWNWKFWESSSSEPAPTAAAESTASGEPAVATAMPAASVATPPAPEPRFVPRPELVDVHFAPSRVTVGQAGMKALDAVVRWLREHPDAHIMLEGHTDSQGSRADNLIVGEKRASTIMTYLVSKGIAPERITVTSYGSDRPVCSEKTAACRARNRRVRFLVKQPS